MLGTAHFFEGKHCFGGTMNKLVDVAIIVIIPKYCGITN